MTINKKKLRLEKLEEKRLLTTYVVTNTSDSGEGSLRQAILDANSNPNPEDGPDRIEFQIEADSFVIRPESRLPVLTDSVIVDGRTQPGYENAPIVEVSGSLMTEATGNEIGLEVGWRAEASEIRGLIVNSFLGDQIRVRGSSSVIAGNYIGLSSDGSEALGGSKGIWLAGDSNLVGGVDSADRNVISGNENGVWVTGNSNHIVGNFVGTDASGLLGLGNTNSGIVSAVPSAGTMIGGEEEGTGNVVVASGRSGIQLTGDAMAQNNLVGVAADGSTALGNQLTGIEVASSSGLSIVGNTVANSAGAGVRVSNATGISILGNSIFANSTDIDLGPAGPTANDPSDADTGDNELQNHPVVSFEQTDAGLAVTYSVDSAPTNAAYPLRVEFFALESDGVNARSTLLGWDEYSVEDMAAGTKTLTFDGTELGSRQSVVATATDANGNTSEVSPGLLFTPEVDSDFVVTSTADEGPGTLRQAILDANENEGLDIISFNIEGDSTRIQPLTPLPVILDPVVIDGRTQPGYEGQPIVELNGDMIDVENIEEIGLEIAWNVSGSAVYGLVVNQFSTDGVRIRGNETIISGNYIGTSADGSEAMGNGRGVLIFGDNNQIGGANIEDRNVISGNGNGIWVNGKGNSVAGNFIGTDATGNAALTGQRTGVVVSPFGNGTQVGGGPAGQGNVIAGNERFGLNIAVASSIQQNLIGVGADGETAVGNAIAGIIVGNDSGDVMDVMVGGNSESLGNVIANSPRGVWVLSNDDGVSERIAILGNSIYASATPVLLGSSSLIANDEGDADEGPNRLQNYPEIETVTTDTGAEIRYRVPTDPAATPEGTYPIRVEFYAVGAASATQILVDEFTTEDFANDGTKNLAIDALPENVVVVGLATDAAGNTSAVTPTETPTEPEPTEPTEPEPTEPTDPGVVGDFNGDDEVTTTDIDLLFNAIGDNSDDASFDLNDDGAVTTGDVDYLIEEVLRTLRGDVDLDGEVNFNDFLVLSQNFGQTVDGYVNGDFDGDGMANFTDFLFLSGNFGKKVEEPTEPEPTEPEPTEPEPTEPEPTEPEPTEPEPTEPEPTEPEPGPMEPVQVDEQEPNEQSTDATPITDSSELLGLSLDRPEDIDWYTWTASDTGTLSIKLTTPTDRQGFAIRLFVGKPDTALSVTELDPGLITLPVQEGERYLLQISSAAKAIDIYDLSLQLTLAEDESGSTEE